MLRTMNTVFLALCFIGAVADATSPAADPGFPSAYFAIRPDPTPGIVDELNEITVLALNYGEADAKDVAIELSYNDWGVTFMGWQEIGTVSLDIDAMDNGDHVFEHVFESRAHVCLQAEIVSVGEGGNSNSWNDRTQINWEVVHAGESAWVYVPFGNGADEEIVVEGTEIQCVENGTVVPCEGTYEYEGEGSGGYQYQSDDDTYSSGGGNPNGSGDRGWESSFFARRSMAGGRRNAIVSQPPTIANVPSSLRANEEVVAELNVPEVADGMVVMVEAMMGPAGKQQRNNVMIQIVKTTVEQLLNEPMLCCIQSIKTRVMLESMLAEALDAYEAEECKKAIKILRMFIQKAILLECDLTKEEKACIEKALVRVVDAARMIAIELGTHTNLQMKVKEGDYFRRAGLYEAALLEYAKAC